MATATTIVGSGTLTYEVNEDWAKLPEGWTMPAAAVTVGRVVKHVRVG